MFLRKLPIKYGEVSAMDTKPKQNHRLETVSCFIKPYNQSFFYD